MPYNLELRKYLAKHKATINSALSKAQQESTSAFLASPHQCNAALDRAAAASLTRKKSHASINKPSSRACVPRAGRSRMEMGTEMVLSRARAVLLSGRTPSSDRVLALTLSSLSNLRVHPHSPPRPGHAIS
jgi:hypothetical protein